MGKNEIKKYSNRNRRNGWSRKNINMQRIIERYRKFNNITWRRNIQSNSIWNVKFKAKYSVSQNLDAFEIMKKLGIEIKLENRETVIYMNGKKQEMLI